ncbi:transmembrane protein, putative (macronuclear) [Tetrahymena thermophila SB210]|uniref:Transmembrane protein, putative n=1 Tax=Tetrahymena thermophila (strain SB210) TaxID=312017 RepID=X1W3W8_TETTS|nr:transmembrane protein, putative [Tetrahymena thermophila SB210]EDK31701.1 transmembrane protein, putative [Tetrahymena thermophila SB210]|eukprot:XP_001470829.1 transmembrane protein, putative [Tetrahymena thermophila SB210]
MQKTPFNSQITAIKKSQVTLINFLTDRLIFCSTQLIKIIIIVFNFFIKLNKNMSAFTKSICQTTTSNHLILNEVYFFIDQISKQFTLLFLLAIGSLPSPCFLSFIRKTYQQQVKERKKSKTQKNKIGGILKQKIPQPFSAIYLSIYLTKQLTNLFSHTHTLTFYIIFINICKLNPQTNAILIRFQRLNMHFQTYYSIIYIYIIQYLLYLFSFIQILIRTIFLSLFYQFFYFQILRFFFDLIVTFTKFFFIPKQKKKKQYMPSIFFVNQNSFGVVYLLFRFTQYRTRTTYNHIINNHLFIYTLKVVPLLYTEYKVKTLQFFTFLNNSSFISNQYLMQNLHINYQLLSYAQFFFSSI